MENVKSFEVRSFDIRSRATIFALIFCGLLTIMGTVLLLSLSNQREEMIIPVTILGVIMTLPFPLFVTIIVTSSVKFEDGRITSISIFGKRTIYADDLKSFGTFIVDRYSARIVDSGELNERSFELNMILLTDSQNFSFNKLKVQKHIRLQYRKEVYEKIKLWIKTTSEQAGAIE